MGTAVNLYTRIYPQGKGAKGLYYGGTESKYAILGGGGEVIHDKMEYSLNPRQSSNSAAAEGQTFTTSNLVNGSGMHGNGASISGISITPSTIEIDANPSSSSTREIRRTVSQVHNAYGIGYTGASCELVFSQGRDYVSSMTLSLGTPSVLTAGGGSVNSCSYTLTVNWASGKQQTYDSIIPNGAAINWTGVTAGSKGTTISNQTTAGTLRCTVSFDGKTASDSATVYQSGNYVTSIDLTGFAIAYSKSVSAAGGTVSPTVTNGTVRFYYSSGSNGTATPSSTYGSLTSAIKYSGNASNGFSSPNATTGAMTASDRGTVTGSARNSGTVTATRTVTWTPSGSYNSSGVKSDSMSDSDYATQVANSMESRVYDAPTFSLASSYTFGEDGGSYTINPTGGKQTYTDTYTSGSHSTGSTTLSGTYSYIAIYEAIGFGLNGNVVSASKNTATTARSGPKVRVILTANEKSSYKDITFSQEAASLNVEGWSISLTYSDIPASGGSVNPNLSYTFTYVSGGTTHRVTSGAGVSYDYNNGIVSASNLGMMEKERTLIKTITVTLSYALNGQTYTGRTTANVYQEANVLTHGYAIIGHSLNSSHIIYPKLIDGVYHFALTIEYDYNLQTTNWEGERKILTIANTSAYTSGVSSIDSEGLTSTQDYQLSTTVTTDSNIRIRIQSLMRTGIEFTVYSNYRYPNFITSIPTWEATLIHSSQISVDFIAHFYYIGVRNLDPIEIPAEGGNVLIGVNTNADKCGFESQGGAPIIEPFRGTLYNHLVGQPLCQGTVTIDANSGTTAKNFSIRYFLSRDELTYPIIGVNGRDYVEMEQDYTQPAKVKEQFRIDLDDRQVAGSQFAYFKRIDNQGNFINSAPTSNLTLQGQLQYQTLNETSHLQNFSVIWSAGNNSCMVYLDAPPQINNINFVGAGFTITPSEDDTYIYTK